MKNFTRIRFDQIETQVPCKPGIYEIYMEKDVPLKVGIGVNLRKRLLQHRASKQRYLQLKSGGDWVNPAHVVSKRWVLAKHLYFDRTIVGFDLTTELGRHSFLLRKCYIKFKVTPSKAAARTLERVSEAQGRFRYVGRAEQRGIVIKRRHPVIKHVMPSNKKLCVREGGHG